MEYLNAIDATHRSELERLNEANWLRFEARLDQRMAELRSDLAALKAELLKWMFLFWVGTIGTVIALGRISG